jgi:site-specific DNA-methyltransferase (adenine-specific)
MLHDWKNKLYYGNNLEILRDYIRDESIDLIYLDPPFNSAANYNILFKETSGEQSAAQITAFEDTWHWTQEAEHTYHELITSTRESIANLMQSFRSFLGTSDMMAYLTMMAPRLVELHRVLKDTGSIYLHCDPTASHYLKLLLDSIFQPYNFRNEIVWCYKTRHFSKRNFGKKHDVIFFYTKGDSYTFNWQNVLRPLSPVTIKKFKLKDDIGFYRLVGRGIVGSPIQSAKDVDQKWEVTHPHLVKRDYLKEGVPPEDYWLIDIINQSSNERLGYPTQKPEELLERIIKASSNEGDIVLDPFCGCGTTVNVAERLHRRWIGIDITHLAISLIKTRLHDTFKNELADYEVIGEPKDLSSAEALALQDRYQFQWWAVGLVEGRPAQDKKKGKDTGIDGNLYFFDDNIGKAKRIIIQVKSGNVKSGDIRDLKGVLEREKAELGAFISLKPATRDMIKEAVSAGFYESQHYGKFPKLQILTVEEILNGAKLQYPQTGASGTFKRAERQSKSRTEQDGLF